MVNILNILEIFRCFQILIFIPHLGSLPGTFDVVIPNKHLKNAYTDLRNFVVKELETQRDQGINVQLLQVELPPSP